MQIFSKTSKESLNNFYFCFENVAQIPVLQSSERRHSSVLPPFLIIFKAEILQGTG